MGRWKGDADATQESGGGGGNKFPPAPRGFYTIQVADVEEGQTHETGRDKVSLTCEIADDGAEFGKKVWLNITHIPKGQKGHGLMIHQLHAFGLGFDGNYDFDPAKELQGRRADVLLGVEQRERSKNGRVYVNDVNFVEALYTEKHPRPDETPPVPAPRQPAAKAASKLAGQQAQPDFEEVPF